MATQKLNLTRDQLATFLKNQEQIRQFERLFQVADQVSPSSDTPGIEIQAGQAQATANEALAQISRLAQSLELLATAPVIENNNSVATDYIDFNTNTPAPAVKVGRLHWNGGYTLNLEMTPNVNQAIGESQYYYIKASAAIAKGELVMFDGSVGSSGVLKGKPSTGVTNGQLIMGVAAEAIANNGFGLVSSFGLVRGFNTTGTPYGETWADGDILYYNPSFAGGLSKNIPAAPTPHVVVAAVVNAATAGSGSVFVRVQAEPLISQLSDVYVPTLSNGDLLQYDSTLNYWKNVAPTSVVAGAGGSTTQLQYNNAGTLDGAANLQYDGTNLGIGLTPTGSALLQVAPGSITKAPFELTTSAGAVMTVPDDGSFEYDGLVFYATPNANNRGVTVNEHFVARTGTKTMTSNTSFQAVFSGGSGGLTNGALTVNGSTSYYFECSLNLSSMSSSSGNLGFSIVGAGTATFTSAAWHAFGLDATTQTTGAAIGGSFSAAAGATGNISTAATGTSYSVFIKGIFRINDAGTIIPSVRLTTASAAVVGANCWFKCNAIGTNTVVSVGNWS